MNQRRVITLATVLFLGLLAIVGCAAQPAPAGTPSVDSPDCDDPRIAEGVPLPFELAIAPPAADVPSELAAFSGLWCGVWDDGTATVLAVETVTPPMARVVYAVGTAGDGAPGRWWRVEARFSGETLVVRPFPGHVLTYALLPDGTLEAAYGFEHVAGRTILTRGSGPTDEPSREFDGIYFTMFEVSAFNEGLGCVDRRDAWWLEATPGSGFYEGISAYRETDDMDQSGQFPYHRYHVRFIGHLSPPGHYGHLSAYPRKVTVERLLEVGPAPDCPAP